MPTIPPLCRLQVHFLNIQQRHHFDNSNICNVLLNHASLEKTLSPNPPFADMETTQFKIQHFNNTKKYAQDIHLKCEQCRCEGQTARSYQSLDCCSLPNQPFRQVCPDASCYFLSDFPLILNIRTFLMQRPLLGENNCHCNGEEVIFFFFFFKLFCGPRTSEKVRQTSLS